MALAADLAHDNQVRVQLLRLTAGRWASREAVDPSTDTRILRNRRILPLLGLPGLNAFDMEWGFPLLLFQGSLQVLDGYLADGDDHIIQGIGEVDRSLQFPGGAPQPEPLQTEAGVINKKRP